jgi:two-component system NtrC family sensor kinase
MKDARSLSHRILRYSSEGMQRVEFIHQVAKMLLEASGADVVELCMRESDASPHWRARLGREVPFLVEIMTTEEMALASKSSRSRQVSEAEELCGDFLSGRVKLPEAVFTKNGLLWGHTSNRPLSFSMGIPGAQTLGQYSTKEGHRSLVLAPLEAAGTNTGVLGFMSKTPDYFTENDIEFFEDLAQTLSVAFVNRSAQAALRERVKELTCLYGIARLVEKPESSREEILRGIVALLPPAWQYPEITVARIVMEGKAYESESFRDTGQKQAADIIVNGERRGVVEVVYLKERPRRDEGPFLKEERHLIDAIAREVALILERDQAEQEKRQLQEQLWHSDRLATIGELAAGVAHELNEPLGSILGFAQLTLKCDDLPAEAAEDIEKIVTASLHAREVIRKLMLFARQKRLSKTKVNLNAVVDDGLYLLSARCAAARVDVERELADNLPEITADPVQLHQALINLIVNAIHAMPRGGHLKIRTRSAKHSVVLTVQDDGIGMNEELTSKIFLPFFTTKDVNQGTGLGLSVVHGIVTSHGGSITVDSEEGRGTTFEVMLPVTGSPQKEASS